MLRPFFVRPRSALGDVGQELVDVSSPDVEHLALAPGRQDEGPHHGGDVPARVGRLLRDVLVEIPLYEIGHGRGDPSLVALVERVAPSVDFTLEPLGLVPGRGNAPGRVVANEKAPSPRLERVVEREAFSPVAPNLEPEADDLVIHEDRRPPMTCDGCLREALCKRHPHHATPIVVLRLRRQSTAAARCSLSDPGGKAETGGNGLNVEQSLRCKSVAVGRDGRGVSKKLDDDEKLANAVTTEGR